MNASLAPRSSAMSLSVLCPGNASHCKPKTFLHFWVRRTDNETMMFGTCFTDSKLPMRKPSLFSIDPQEMYYLHTQNEYSEYHQRWPIVIVRGSCSRNSGKLLLVEIHVFSTKRTSCFSDVHGVIRTLGRDIQLYPWRKSSCGTARDKLGKSEICYFCFHAFAR